MTENNQNVDTGKELTEEELKTQQEAKEMEELERLEGLEDKNKGTNTPPNPAIDPLVEPKSSIEIEVDIENEITQELEDDVTVEDTGDSNIKANTPDPLDAFFANLTPEAVNRLKDRLETTPRMNVKKTANPVVTLKMIDNKVVIDNKDQVESIIRDQATGQTKSTFFVPVKFHGEKEYFNIPYEEFRDAKRIDVELLDIESKEDPVHEGDVNKRNEEGYQTNEVTARITTYIREVKLVKLPTGEKVKVNKVNV